MPAPTPAQLTTLFMANFAGQKTKEADEYLQKLFTEITSAWTIWQNSFKFGAVTVTGAGVGAWSGIGVGGSAVSGPFTMKPFVFGKNTPQQEKLTKILGTVLQQKFQTYASSFKITTANYIGASSATGANPGPFNALIVPTPLIGCSAGAAPSGIAALWKAQLTPPDFQLSNPNAKASPFIDAVSSAIEQAFTMFWLTTSTVSLNSVVGAGAPGGAGSAPSLLNGTII